MPSLEFAAAGTQQTHPAAPGVQISVTDTRKQILKAGLTLLLSSLLVLHPEIIVRRGFGQFGSDVFFLRGIFRTHIALVAAALIGWFLQPSLSFAVTRWRTRLSPQAQRGLAAAAVTLACVLAAAFIIGFGRWQFGGFDYNILLEVGWRQFLGQRPYVDFLTTSPPFFNLGAYLAFRLFGVSWDGMLLFTAVFTASTLVWFYLLFRRLGMGSIAALGMAWTTEVVTMLSCCFWWYNNTTLLLAALFFLSAILLARTPLSRFAGASYVVSLGLLALAKPNIAGVLIAGCMVLLLVISRDRGRILLLSVLGGLLTLLILKLGHISIPAMLTAYRGAAKERGALSSFGYQEFQLGEKRLITLWYAALFLPLLTCLRPLRADIRARSYSSAAFWLFFPLAALVTLYGLLGNGELRDVETAVLVSALGLLAFVYFADNGRLQRYTVALLCGTVAANLYIGAARERVYTVGPHMFFEWQDRNHVLTTGPLKNMRVSGSFAAVDQEMQQAIQSNPGPVFFGPRVDFGYMVFGLPSPLHFPAWWHPGTAFDRALVPEVVQHWEQQRYPTLIYLKNDYTYYPEQLKQDLRNLYIRDDRSTMLTIYRRRPGL